MIESSSGPSHSCPEGIRPVNESACLVDTGRVMIKLQDMPYMRIHHPEVDSLLVSQTLPLPKSKPSLMPLVSFRCVLLQVVPFLCLVSRVFRWSWPSPSTRRSRHVLREKHVHLTAYPLGHNSAWSAVDVVISGWYSHAYGAP